MIEVLLALVVLALASVALIIAFSTSIAASAEHRRLASDDTVLATASQEIISAIQNEPNLFTDACTTPITSYPDYSPDQGFPLPAPYASETTTTGFDVQYLTQNPTLAQYPVEWWDATTGTFTPNCVDNVPQLITISMVGTSYTNSFVVDYPVGNSGGTSGSSTSNETLVFLNQGSIGTSQSYAGSPISPQPIVAVESNGVPVSTDLSPVTISIYSGTGVISGCSGNEVLGVVTFSGCTIGSGGTFQIQATDGSLTSAPSNSFTVTSSQWHLVFTTPPTAGASGSPFASPAPAVTVENSVGATDTAWQGTITLTASGGEITNCARATSTTTVVLPVTNGVATLPNTANSSTNGCYFSGGYFYNPNSSPQVTATQYTFTATANPTNPTDAAVPATSTTFSVSSFGPAAQLAFTVNTTGVASATATTPFTVQPVVAVEDSYGNVVTSANNAVTLSIQGATGESLQSGCTYSLSEGSYTYSGCAGNKYNNNLYLVASSGSLTSATGTTFNITRVASQLLFTTSPVAGASASAFTVQPSLVFEDSTNSVVTAETSPITFTVSPSSGTIATCTNLTPSNGDVYVRNCTFAGLVGTPYTLTASTTTGTLITSAPSATFSPTAPGPATQLVFTQEPVAGASQSLLTQQPVVKVEDSAGNIVTSSNASIVLTSSGNGAVAGCTGLTASAGVANVSNCTFAGNVGTQYYLIATSGTLSGDSTTLSPTGPGPLTQILLSGCSSNITVSAQCILNATLADYYGNTETTDSLSTATFAQIAGTGVVTGLGNYPVSAGVALDTLTGATGGPVSVTASADGVTSNTISFTVNAKPSITTTSLPGATQTGAYSTALAGTGGTTPYTWSITTGSLPSGLTLNASTGVISGTVGATATSQTFTVTLTDADGVTATQALTLSVNAKPTITTASLATATQNEINYSQPLTGTGGTTPYTWSVSTGHLPTGLSINSATGAITGTVGSTATSQTFTVTLTDANGVTATKSYTLTVNAAPTIAPSTLPGATQSGAYSQTLTVSGGTAPFGSWSITTGVLPSGLGLNTSTGVISGTVGSSATSQTFTVSITDANGVAATKTYTLTVNGAPSITTSSLATATQTQTGYSQTLVGTGGTTPYLWSITTGSLPSGLSLNASTGAITGTVGASATSQTFTVTLTDANGVTATKSLSITVNVAPSITTTSLATATQNETGYSQTLAGTGGTTPYAWSVTTGSLPSGLTLNSSTGVISGTLGASATSQTFTVTLTDANNVKATKSLTLTVNAAPSISTTSLPAATQTETGYSTTLAGTGGTTPYAWSITTGSLPSGLTLNASTGVISGNVGATATSQDFLGDSDRRQQRQGDEVLDADRQRDTVDLDHLARHRHPDRDRLQPDLGGHRWDHAVHVVDHDRLAAERADTQRLDRRDLWHRWRKRHQSDLHGDSHRREQRDRDQVTVHHRERPAVHHDELARHGHPDRDRLQPDARRYRWDHAVRVVDHDWISTERADPQRLDRRDLGHGRRERHQSDLHGDAHRRERRQGDEVADHHRERVGHHHDDLAAGGHPDRCVQPDPGRDRWHVALHLVTLYGQLADRPHPQRLDGCHHRHRRRQRH